VRAGTSVILTPECDWRMQEFDDLLLMKVGGEIIYQGPLGTQSAILVQYLEVRPVWKLCSCLT